MAIVTCSTSIPPVHPFHKVGNTDARENGGNGGRGRRGARQAGALEQARNVDSVDCAQYDVSIQRTAPGHCFACPGMSGYMQACGVPNEVDGAVSQGAREAGVRGNRLKTEKRQATFFSLRHAAHRQTSLAQPAAR